MADEAEVVVSGVEEVIGKLRDTQRDLEAELIRFVHRGTEMIFGEVRRNASLVDHTLADLARLGNPYARRWGSDSLHPDYLLHIQSGALAGMLTMRGPERDGDDIVGSVTSGAWYSAFLEFGTVKMRPRPFMTKALEDTRGPINEAYQHLFDQERSGEETERGSERGTEAREGGTVGEAEAAMGEVAGAAEEL